MDLDVILSNVEVYEMELDFMGVSSGGVEFL